MTDCTIQKTVSFISKRWTLLIIHELSKKESIRYNELKKALNGITAKIMSARLTELQKEGLVKKRVDSSCYPPICEYSLTKSGKDFFKVIKAIKNWGVQWKPGSNMCEYYDCRKCV